MKYQKLYFVPQCTGFLSVSLGVVSKKYTLYAVLYIGVVSIKRTHYIFYSTKYKCVITLCVILYCKSSYLL